MSMEWSAEVIVYPSRRSWRFEYSHFRVGKATARTIPLLLYFRESDTTAIKVAGIRKLVVSQLHILPSFTNLANMYNCNERLLTSSSCSSFFLLPLDEHESRWQKSNPLFLLTIREVSRNHHTWKYLPIVVQFNVNFAELSRYIITMMDRILYPKPTQAPFPHTSMLQSLRALK